MNLYNLDPRVWANMTNNKKIKCVKCTDAILNCKLCNSSNSC